VGDRLPERRIDPVKRWPMKVLALVLDDPNPLHWDPASVAALGLGDRPVNQGPMSMGWIVDMLVAWVGGPARVCDVSVRFRGNVFAGDVVVAGGRVEALESAARGRVATCAVWLVRDDGTPLVSGSASVELGQ